MPDSSREATELLTSALRSFAESQRLLVVAIRNCRETLQQGPVWGAAYAHAESGDHEDIDAERAPHARPVAQPLVEELSLGGPRQLILMRDYDYFGELNQRVEDLRARDC